MIEVDLEGHISYNQAWDIVDISTAGERGPHTKLENLHLIVPAAKVTSSQ